MPRRVLARILLIAGLAVTASTPAAGAAAAGAAAAGAAVSSAYSWPLPGSPIVLRPFRPPATPYGAGNRGIDLSAAPGAVVYAAAAGIVTFSGSVAGRGVVVVSHPDGVSTEYEPLAAMPALGQRVARGDPIGVIAGMRAACGPASCLHWGARRGDVYIDPTSLLTALGRVRLVAW